MNVAEEHNIERLKPREAPKIDEWIAEMTGALGTANGLSFYDRIQHCRNTRFCIWEGGNWTGTKLPVDKDADEVRDVFPWPGASDNRVPLVDELINERVALMAEATERADKRVLPRDLNTDEGAGRSAALWQLVANYYDDVAGDYAADEMDRWCDMGEEFGHAVLRVGWRERVELEKRTITVERVKEIAAAAALAVAVSARIGEIQAAGEPVPPPDESGLPPVLTPEELASIETAAATDVEAMLADPELREQFVAQLVEADPDMPESEARFVATRLRRDREAEYYARTVIEAAPRPRALMPFIDVFYPPMTTCLEEARWIAEVEWVSGVQLRERVVNEGYDERWVEKVIEVGAGRSFQAVDDYAEWVLSGGSVGTSLSDLGGGEAGIADTKAEDDREKEKLFQIVHLYYRATTIEGVPALYRTVLHGQVGEGMFGLHECQPDAHGRYPYVEYKREKLAPYLTGSRGIGEVTFTDQREVKIQRDMRSDLASLTVKPPVEVPWALRGKKLDLRPGRQVPRNMTAGAQGGVEWMKPPGGAEQSREIEDAARAGFDRYWGRGAEVDAEVKLVMRQRMVRQWFRAVRRVKLLEFALIQEYAPEEIRASAVRGVPVSLAVPKAEIQGQVAIDLVFDAADLDAELLGKKLELLVNGLRPLDATGILRPEAVVRMAVRSFLPGWADELLGDPVAVEQDEIDDEQKAVSLMSLGIEPRPVPGRNHALRLQVLADAMGGPNSRRLQEIMASTPEVAELFKKRAAFHQFQVDQYQVNPDVGRLGVEPPPPPGQGFRQPPRSGGEN